MTYRFGFNDKENDNEVKGEGNQQDYGMRIYDPRLGKFLSVDPINKQYPFYTPYQFAGNKPIIAIDLDGAEELIRINYPTQKDKPSELIIVDSKIIETYAQALWNNLVPYPKGKFNESNTSFVRGKKEYSYGNKDYNYIQLRPSTGQLDINVTADGYYLSFSNSVTKDELYHTTFKEYTFGQSYDRSSGLGEIGSLSSKLALGSAALPVVGQAMFGMFETGSKVLSGVSDATEIIIDFAYGKKEESAGKFLFAAGGVALGGVIDKSHSDKFVRDVTGNGLGQLYGEAKSAAYQSQQKPSANKMRGVWEKTMKNLVNDKNENSIDFYCSRISLFNSILFL